MTRSRFFLLALGILLFSVAAAGLYLRQNLPWILQLQAQQFLQQYGVEEFEFEGLHVADGIVRVDTLVLHGNVDTLAYRATLTGGEMHYNWRMLFQGKLQTLNLENLDIAIEQTITSDSEPLASIRLDEWLPLHWISQLPV